MTGKDHTPALFGGDLNAADKNAFQENHDADQQPALSPDSRTVQPSDVEKADPNTDIIEQDPDLVDWDGPDDPANPQNWSSRWKWGNIAVLSAITFLVPLGSSFFAPAVPELLQEFDEHNQALATFVVSVYVLGFAFGPLLVAPLSEVYGRLPVYHLCNLGFIIFTVAAAVANSMSSLIVFRFFQGAFGAAPLSNGGGTIADLMPPEQRGLAMSFWAAGPLLGPVIAPICGSFLSAAAGWRWIYWVTAIAVGVVEIFGIAFLRETYAPVLLQRKASKLRKATGNDRLRSKLDNGLTARELMLRAIIRPTKLLFLSPVCTLMSIYMAVVYGILYLLFTTFTFVFELKYGFSQSVVGLTYVAIGIGMFFGLGLMGAISDPWMKRLAAKHSGGKVRPEYRLPPLMYASPCLPIGLFIYGWTAQYGVHWIVPMIGTFFVGVALIAAFMCINTYLVDTYSRYAASAMAANTLLRSVFGAVFPLFALQMYGKLGLGWGNSLLAFICLALIPIPYLFYSYGERLRTNPRFRVEF